MIYNIVVMNNDEDYRDVGFFCGLDGYNGPTWKRTVTLTKADETTATCDWEFSANNSDCFDEFIGTPPYWVTNLFDRLTPIMEQMARTGEPHRHPMAAEADYSGDRNYLSPLIQEEKLSNTFSEN